jgi:2-polyprenyl-6-hydroxyphenyl methylase/3-demethylubiquinone-9 3-methyltransferase
VTRLRTRVVRSPDEVAAHFDRAATQYREAHGHAEDLLAYRVGVITDLLVGANRGTLLEIGCGTAVHLLALADQFDAAIGTDVSTEMIRAATTAAAASTLNGRVSVRVDAAETLASVDDASVDVVLCVGALEHMVDRPAVLARVHRVLRAGGRFVCLTPNGGHWWYRWLAPLLRRETRHLSTDRFLTPEELGGMLHAAGFDDVSLRWWRFVPRADVSPVIGGLLHSVESIGAPLGVGKLQGGIAASATKT